MKTTIPEAQRRNAALYREHARRAPRNSKTRAEWLRLAGEAEACARRYEPGGETREPEPVEFDDRLVGRWDDRLNR